MAASLRRLIRSGRARLALPIDRLLTSFRITAVSRSRGTRRIQEVTGGHEEHRARVQEEPCGPHRTREDTASRRFGTVRPRVQIPGPRPFFELRISESDGSRAVAVAQGGHRFSWKSMVAAPSKRIADRRLNSLTALAQPIYPAIVPPLGKVASDGYFDVKRPTRSPFPSIRTRA